MIEDNPIINSTIIPTNLFSQKYLHEVVETALIEGKIPKEHKIAFIGVVNNAGLKAIVAYNRENFKVQAVIEYDWTRDNRVGAEFLFSK